MKLLLRQDIAKLGIVGDVVDVSAGYARNYLLPQRLAMPPTEANMKRLAEMRKHAEEKRRLAREAMEREAQKLAEVEVTITAAANEDGVLYGSVGRKEIAAALHDDGHRVEADQIVLEHPLRQLDSVMVDVRFTDDIRAQVKVWVVRAKDDNEGEAEGGPDDSQ